MKITNLLKKHENWRKSCINLIASENVMSPKAKNLYISDLMHRYAEGLPFKRYYQGLKYYDELEIETQELFKKLFNCKFVDLRPISGTIANLAVYISFLKENDVVFSLPVQCGSHVSHTIHGFLGFTKIKIVEIPFDKEKMNIDVEKTEELIKQYKPKLIILGGSLFLFPHPVKEISKIVHDFGGILMYDAAHVLGLIPIFQDPLKEGADIITSSTHKTFPGPQGGLILSNNEEIFEKVKKNIFPKLVSNHHLHRIPALAQTCIEMLKYGKKYATQVIKNAQNLAKELYNLGFEVLGKKFGFTKSHQVVFKIKSASEVAKILEDNNIIVNKNLIPGDELNIKNPSGIRIGVQEMTRYGCNDMKSIAEFICRSIKGENIKAEVISFRKRYQKVKYC